MGHRVSRSRSAGQRRLAPGLDVKARPEKRPRSLSLGLTTGITAAGSLGGEVRDSFYVGGQVQSQRVSGSNPCGTRRPSCAQHDATRRTLAQWAAHQQDSLTRNWVQEGLPGWHSWGSFFGPRRLGQGIGQAEGHLGSHWELERRLCRPGFQEGLKLASWFHPGPTPLALQRCLRREDPRVFLSSRRRRRPQGRNDRWGSPIVRMEYPTHRKSSSWNRPNRPRPLPLEIQVVRRGGVGEVLIFRDR